MNCPKCNHPETKVTDTRAPKHMVTVPFVKRRRKCLSCNTAWTTIETIVPNTMRVPKK